MFGLMADSECERQQIQLSSGKMAGDTPFKECFVGDVCREGSIELQCSIKYVLWLDLEAGWCFVTQQMRRTASQKCRTKRR